MSDVTNNEEVVETPVEEVVDGDLPVAVDDVLLDAVEHDHVAIGGDHAQARAADVAEVVGQ